MFGSIIGGLSSTLGGIGLGSVGDVLSSWATNSAKESLNKSITKTNMKIQKEYDLWTQGQDKAYEEWWQNYLYGLQNNEYFNLAKKYAQNTASWAVEGLKRAGLNPVLAAIDGNLSSSMGNANPQQSGHSVGSKSIHGASVGAGASGHAVNLAGSIGAIASAKQAVANKESTELNNDITRDTKDSVVRKARIEADNAGYSSQAIQAGTAKTLADAKLVDAQADKVRSETYQLNRNMGQHGMMAGVYRFANEASDMIKHGASKAHSWAMDEATKFRHNVDSALNSAFQHVRGWFDSENSAKSSSNSGSDAVPFHPVGGWPKEKSEVPFLPDSSKRQIDDYLRDRKHSPYRVPKLKRLH